MSKIQYTIRGIPLAVDQTIRKRATRTGKSFNATVVELLSLQTLGVVDSEQDRTSAFDKLNGANTLDEAFDQAIADQSKVDKSLWQ